VPERASEPLAEREPLAEPLGQPLSEPRVVPEGEVVAVTQAVRDGVPVPDADAEPDGVDDTLLVGDELPDREGDGLGLLRRLALLLDHHPHDVGVLLVGGQAAGDEVSHCAGCGRLLAVDEHLCLLGHLDNKQSPVGRCRGGGRRAPGRG